MTFVTTSLVLLFASLPCCIQSLVSPTRWCSCSATPLYISFHNHKDEPEDTCRRRLFGAAASWFLLPQVGHAEDALVDYVRKEGGYSVQLPSSLSEPSNKPLKTHLDEVNFNGDGLQVGITVDPVRISSLRQFGTPPEVAARVVTAEVNRDGVFEVTLWKDPVETQEGAYVLTYLSKGKRGDKRFVCKIYIEHQKLHVLTAQVKEADYARKEKEMMAVVDSFRVLK